MLQRGSTDKPLHIYGYLISVEIEEGGSTTPEQVALRIADSLTFMEDVGKVDVESLGKIECFDEEPT